MVSFDNTGFATPDIPEDLLRGFVQTAIVKTVEDSGKSSEVEVVTARQGLIGNVKKDPLNRSVEGNELESAITIVTQGFELNTDDVIDYLGEKYLVTEEQPYYKNTNLNAYIAERKKK